MISKLFRQYQPVWIFPDGLKFYGRFQNCSDTRSSWFNCALRDDDAVYWVSMRQYQLVIDDTGSVEDIHAFIYCTKWRSGQVLPMPDSLTD